MQPFPNISNSLESIAPPHQSFREILGYIIVTLLAKQILLRMANWENTGTTLVTCTVAVLEDHVRVYKVINTHFKDVTNMFKVTNQEIFLWWYQHCCLTSPWAKVIHRLLYPFLLSCPLSCSFSLLFHLSLNISHPLPLTLSHFVLFLLIFQLNRVIRHVLLPD